MGGAEGTGLYAAFPHAYVVYAKYCDGSSFTGNVSEPVPVTVNASYSTRIFYRGRRVLDALFDELFRSRGLDGATELLLAGCSAGALTTYVHADYVSSLVSNRGAKGAKVVALADAMFSLHHDAFPNVSSNYYTRQFTWGFDAWDSAASVNQACVVAHASQPWVCFHGAVVAPFVSTPLFVANSVHDTWQANGVLGLNHTECPGTFDRSTGAILLCNPTPADAARQNQFWVDYGVAMAAALAPLPSFHAAFLTNCPTHCQTGGPLWAEPAFPGTRLDAAVVQWYPQAIAHVGNASWRAPRWVARSSDGCKLPPTQE
jgi:hypothetical protein